MLDAIAPMSMVEAKAFMADCGRAAGKEYGRGGEVQTAHFPHLMSLYPQRNVIKQREFRLFKFDVTVIRHVLIVH